MEHGQKVKIMEKAQKINQVFQNNQNGLKMQEVFKNLEKGLKKIGFSEMRLMEYLEIIGIIFIKQFKYESRIKRSKYNNETFKTWIFPSI